MNKQFTNNTEEPIIIGQNNVHNTIFDDFAIALEQTLLDGKPYEMHFPQSCVIYLRHTSPTPDFLELKVYLPDESFFIYRTPIVKVQTYTKDAIFQKKLLFFLPYYIMRYEKLLSGKEIDSLNLEPLLQEFDDIRCNLETELYDTGKSVLYKDLINLIIAISDYIVKSEMARERMTKTMGGKILELESERQARLLREHEQRMAQHMA